MRDDHMVLSIKDFCARYRISRNCLYNLWSCGEGPAVMRVGRRRLISVEAAAEWRKHAERDVHIENGSGEGGKP